MSGYEKIIIVGNIGSIEVLPSKQGPDYLRISVAANRGSGDKKTKTWYNVVLYGKMVENIPSLLKVLRVGRSVLCEGWPKNKAFIKKDGSPGVDNTIMAEKLPVLLDAASTSDPGTNQN